MADREFPAIGPDPNFVFPDPVPEPIRHPHNHNFIAMKTARQGGHTRPRRTVETTSPRTPTTTPAPITSS